MSNLKERMGKMGAKMKQMGQQMEQKVREKLSAVEPLPEHLAHDGVVSDMYRSYGQLGTFMHSIANHVKGSLISTHKTWETQRELANFLQEGMGQHKDYFDEKLPDVIYKYSVVQSTISNSYWNEMINSVENGILNPFQQELNDGEFRQLLQEASKEIVVEELITRNERRALLISQGLLMLMGSQQSFFRDVSGLFDDLSQVTLPLQGFLQAKASQVKKKVPPAYSSQAPKSVRPAPKDPHPPSQSAPKKETPPPQPKAAQPPKASPSNPPMESLFSFDDDHSPSGSQRPSPASHSSQDPFNGFSNSQDPFGAPPSTSGPSLFDLETPTSAPTESQGPSKASQGNDLFDFDSFGSSPSPSPAPAANVSSDPFAMFGATLTPQSSQSSSPAPSSPSLAPSSPSSISSEGVHPSFANHHEEEKTTGKPIYKPRAFATDSASVAKRTEEKLNALRERDKKEEMEGEMKRQVEEQVLVKVNAWCAGGRRGNLRALLASLQTILWEGSGWKEVPLGDLLIPSKLKLAYRKALILVHPDKAGDRPIEQRVIAEHIFDILNEAYKKEESLQ